MVSKKTDFPYGDLYTDLSPEKWKNLKTIKDIPKKITKKNFPEEIDIRGEVFIQNSDFKKLKAKFANIFS